MGREDPRVGCVFIATQDIYMVAEDRGDVISHLCYRRHVRNYKVQEKVCEWLNDPVNIAANIYLII